MGSRTYTTNSLDGSAAWTSRRIWKNPSDEKMSVWASLFAKRLRAALAVAHDVVAAPRVVEPEGVADLVRGRLAQAALVNALRGVADETLFAVVTAGIKDIESEFASPKALTDDQRGERHQPE